ncbi:thiamine pyrophosphokinase [Companilactobacillus paralimentarius DSM 13238 = JCM 10415]|jgi:thiamine pyrophosphokinase|uniref:Thiamine diphosphokinase n=1 Tax=Companilactobacillus paralimentarius DSM 13238 = JCM 10415 TaxID=1122151 RepID=A0A0R1P6G0_9LACO|nr:thiamine diphosphokinase [Companilactobacillus paralimentarius]KAE9561862.1 thiamine pyrophosphokinase [Companilactobacillus paralimentarius]KRL28151.1 thiamine pyrophosphokinase [Companilactobacillus paralimentarius DSM 13238 = JCM 10415]MDR4934306.1 thiamine diphosphokinase [Companilactobacillus paralimentarius]QFR68551.1 thiamine diphosphokinase [Companilactobacillus paralimentarius]
MKRVNILLGGPKSEYPDELSKSIKGIPGPWIGADRGSLYLLEQGIIPDIAIGDFDSINKKEQRLLKDNIADFKKFPPEKDDTDSELCLLAAREKYNAQEYYVYGATGGRIDHFLVNLFLPFDPRFLDFYDKLYYKSATNTIRFCKPGRYKIYHENGMKYIAFVNLGPVTHLNIYDAKYKLKDFNAGHPVSWASNEFLGETIDFGFESGIVAVIQSKD